MQLRIWGAIGIASMGWGSSGVATRAALDAGVEPHSLNAIRGTMAAILLLAFFLARRRTIPRERRTWLTGLVMSGTNVAVPFVLLTLALLHASAGFVGILVALIPLVTAVLAHVMLPDEPLHIAKLLGLMVAFGGVALLVFSGDSGLEEGGRPLLALVLAVTAVASMAYSVVYAKQRAGTYDPVELTWIQFALGSIILVATMIAVEGSPSGITVWGWVLLVYLATFGSVMPFLLFYWLLRHVSATKASLIGYGVPLVALVMGIALLDEQLQFGIGVGGLLIIGGVVLTNRSERRFIRV